jgi:adenylate cyclase
MTKKSSYATLALRYTARRPLLTFVVTQINFWTLANVILVSVAYLLSQIVNQGQHIPNSGNFGTIATITILPGIFFGTVHGLAGYYIDRRLMKNQSLGSAILIKGFISLAVIVIVLPVMKYVWFDRFISWTSDMSGMIINDTAWRLTFFVYLLYYFIISLIINFVNQINKRYGPGILIPLLLGSYRTPKEEERIFVFMDLKSSTTIAEKLGHLRYSAFIRDCFGDINAVLYPFRAQVYQYVGDEIIVTWEEQEGLKYHFCIEFYFACKKQFQHRADYYMKHYGILPEFKAGAHSGMVTAVEIGEHKREIAYHGDTLNTAARIQSLCNQYAQSFIISQHLLDKIGTHPRMQTKSLGLSLLKGKMEEVGLVGVTWT